MGLVHGDDPERCYGEGGGRGVHVWKRMYTRGGFMSIYGKTNLNLKKKKRKKGSLDLGRSTSDRPKIF